MQRILITGGNGFLGSNLTKYFVSEGHEVLVVSRKRENVAHGVRFIKHSLPGYHDLADQILAFLPTIIIHCAWDGGNKYSDVNSLHQTYNISYGIELIEIWTHSSHKPRFMGVGSFAEYGRLTKPAVETQECSPTTLYGSSKLCFKDISRMICEQNGIHWTWVRPCYVYGGSDVQTRLIPSIIRKCVANEDIVLDDCTSTIDYVHVDDFCRGVDRIISSGQTGIFNVCSSDEVRVRDLVNTIHTLSSSKSVITFDSSLNRLHLSSYACGNSDKLRSLGWSPLKLLDSGLSELITNEKILNYSDHDGLHSEC